jgi:hypothetical protein
MRRWRAATVTLFRRPERPTFMRPTWTIILFKHQGWKEPVEFMHHCRTKWGMFLLSLKSVHEPGKGTPWPNDIKLE